MIAKLTGKVDTILENGLILDVNGVGYLVSSPRQVLINYAVGDNISLFIETIIREDAFNLYGFKTQSEQDCFKLLTTVQGVGARVALSILSLFNPTELSRVIGLQDKTALSKADGVGPKLAVRLLTELKDKIGKLFDGRADFNISSDSTEQMSSTPALVEDAISALVNLGYKRIDVSQVVHTIAVNENIPELQEVIRRSLKILSK